MVFIPARDPYLRASKEFEGSTVFLEEARKRAEDIPALEVVSSPRAQPQPTREPSQSVESAISRPVVASKGKEVAVQSPENPKKKKRKLVKAPGVEPKKKKLMSFAMLSIPLSTYVSLDFS